PSTTLFRSDFNDDFSSFNLYVVRRYDSNEYLYLKENISSRNSIIINSLDTFVPIDESLSDIITPNILYSKSSSLTQMDNRLVLGNTNIDGYDYDFQSFANSIKVGYEIELEAFSDNLPIGGNYEASGALNNTQIPLLNGKFSDGNSIEAMSFSTPYYLGNTDDKEEAGKTFMRDEVYALGVYFELENGQFTDVYHIPGREANTTIGPEHYGLPDEYGRVVGSTDVNGNWDTNPITVDGVTDQAWKLINTAVQGTLGYYECEDEYPDGYGFPSGKIRHHRIPSDRVEPLFQPVNFEGNDFPYYINRRYIKLTFDYTLPPEL